MLIWHCETKNQNQDLAKNRYDTVKHYTNITMDRSGIPLTAWFLCFVYVCLVFNNGIDPSIGNGTKSPLILACFAVNDVSPLLFFYLW